MEEVKLEWAAGQVAMEEGGRAGGPADALAGDKGHSLQKGRKERGAALPSDAPALTRSKSSSNEISHAEGTSEEHFHNERFLPCRAQVHFERYNESLYRNGMWVFSMWHL